MTHMQCQDNLAKIDATRRVSSRSMIIVGTSLAYFTRATLYYTTIILVHLYRYNKQMNRVMYVVISIFYSV